MTGKHGTPVERFWSKVRPEIGDACWIWAGSRDNCGYGKIRIVRSASMAHRLSWEIHYGPIPAGLCVLHRCDNPPCVRPDHLFLGTHQENMRDRDMKGRGGESKPTRHGEGHVRAKLSEASVRWAREAVAGGRTMEAVAKELGVVRSTVGRAVSGHNWRRVTTRD